MIIDSYSLISTFSAQGYPWIEPHTTLAAAYTYGIGYIVAHGPIATWTSLLTMNRTAGSITESGEATSTIYANMRPNGGLGLSL